MSKRIIICGGNGAGKITFGNALSQAIGIPFFDIEDYYFPDKTKEYIYDSPRSKKHVIELLKKDLTEENEFLLAAVKPDFDIDITEMYTVAIYIKVSKHTRLERVKKRSYQKIGEKMLLGGKLFKRENNFFRMIEERSEADILEWLERIRIPIIELDGTKPIKNNVDFIIRKITSK